MHRDFEALEELLVSLHLDRGELAQRIKTNAIHSTPWINTPWTDLARDEPAAAEAFELFQERLGISVDEVQRLCVLSLTIPPSSHPID